jgi:malate dehydrogenase
MDRAAILAGHLLPASPATATRELAPSDVAGVKSTPIRVCITGAAGQIAYSLIFMIARGLMFGPKQTVVLSLLDIPQMLDVLKGVVMEIEDGAYPLVKGIIATADVKEAFLEVNAAILAGSFPRRPGMERKDLLEKNANIFKEQGKALDQFAARDVKVLVVGNPANTNALIAMSCAPSLPKQNFSALTRLDHNRAKAMLAKKLGADVETVSNVVIWGNHSSTQYPDINHGVVRVKGKKATPIRAALNNDHWVAHDFIPAVQQRGAEVMKLRKLSSAASAAQAIVDHMYDWIHGTPAGEFISMAVYSDGSYGVKDGLIYSFPVTCSKGTYTIVKGLNIDQLSRAFMARTEEELVEERATAFSFLGLKTN